MEDGSPLVLLIHEHLALQEHTLHCLQILLVHLQQHYVFLLQLILNYWSRKQTLEAIQQLKPTVQCIVVIESLGNYTS